MADMIANEDDVRHAYRLLLGREPDQAGIEHHRNVLERYHPTTRELANAFLQLTEYAFLNSQLPIEVALDGYSVFVASGDADIGRHIAVAQQYEPHVTRILRERLRSGDVFVDVGANIGFFTNLAAHLVGPTGRVVAIEPMDKNLQLIYRSLSRNGYRHVRVHACAVADSEQIVCIGTGAGTSNGQVLNPDLQDEGFLRTQTHLLDDLVSDLERLDLVKLDIEGFEPRAWSGFQRALRRHQPLVLTEFHPHCMRTHAATEPEDYLRELFAYGEVFVLPLQGGPERCQDIQEAMRHWEAGRRTTRGDGTNHLDLMVQPKR